MGIEMKQKKNWQLMLIEAIFNLYHTEIETLRLAVLCTVYRLYTLLLYGVMCVK